MKNTNKNIAELIVKAQLASDAGKSAYTDLDRNINRYTKRTPDFMGYDVKVDLIAAAIKSINRCKSVFNYWVTATPDQNGYASILVYFTFKHEGKRYQISFHNPYGKADKLLPYVGKGMPMRWNKSIGGSRKACELLASIYDLNREC